MSDKYDAVVSKAVQENPLGFLDTIQDQAELAERGQIAPRDLVPVLKEASCVIANLLLTTNSWHKTFAYKSISNDAKTDILDVLMNADAVYCNHELCQPTTLADRDIYIIPTDYRVTIDYNVMAAALYDAGYRKIEE